MKVCHVCKKNLSFENKIGRKEECPFCRSDLHCCLNCAFYNSSVSKQCREPIAEPVKEKAKANFCDYFSFGESRNSIEESAADKARKALDGLFKQG